MLKLCYYSFVFEIKNFSVALLQPTHLQLADSVQVINLWLYGLYLNNFLLVPFPHR